ncbi:Triacylglycerol lipase [Bertholletia excelsa]
MWTEVVIAVGVAVVVWGWKAVRPPPPRICGSKNGPPVSSPRIRLSDGRHLAYKEIGVPKHEAKYKVVVVHGFDSSKDLYLPLSQELIEEVGIYVVTYDRAGYGESDPHPKRTLKSGALDLQELADQLQLGPKFYVIGLSIGTHSTWACLKYIPHRLAGLALIVPVVNFWWPSFPPELMAAEYKTQPKRDQLKLRIAHYAPGLLYWWMTQKWYTPCSVVGRDPVILSKRDIDTIKKMSQVPNPNEHKIRQQGEFESLYKDLIVGFGNWEFDPMDLENPFPDSEDAVQLWQGRDDTLVPFRLQRFLAHKLPWIKYYEVPDGGHLIIHDEVLCNAIFRALLLKEKPTVI